MMGYAAGGCQDSASSLHSTEHRRPQTKPITVVGVLLIVLGVVAFAYQGITYTSKEKVVDLGPLKVEAKREKTIPLPPVLGGIALVGGIVLVIAGARR
jgi:hypothetical protein